MNMLLDDPMPQMKVAALEALAQVAERSDDRCLENIYACAEDRDANVRRSAMAALGQLAPKGKILDMHAARLAHARLDADVNASVRRTAEDAFVAMHYPLA